MLRLLVQFGVIILATNADIPAEPNCLSRFDHDYKVMQKLAMLELQQTELQKTISSYKDIIKQLTGKVTSTEDTVDKLGKVISLAGPGSTYVRWGKSTCPDNGTEMVYEGFSGGSSHSHSGGASEYVCLPRDPLWDHYEDAEQGGGKMYGAEFELTDRKSRKDFVVNDHFNAEVPCVVCRTTRSSVLLVPGRNVCPESWTLEYFGYLTSGHTGHTAPSEFVCLDKKPENLGGGHKDQDGKLFYFVEGKCGSLKCPPYVNGRELTCAVCSK